MLVGGNSQDAGKGESDSDAGGGGGDGGSGSCWPQTGWTGPANRLYKKLIGEPIYSIYAARQENPNAYDPWTEEADNELRQMWSEGVSVTDIAAHFGRKQSAVIVRLKKLGL